MPPPESSGRSRNKAPKAIETSTNNATISSVAHAASMLSPTGGNSPATLPPSNDDDDSWLHELHMQPDVFDTSKTGMPLAAAAVTHMPMAPLATSESTSTPTQQLSEASTSLAAEMAADLSTLSAGGISHVTDLMETMGINSEQRAATAVSSG